MQFIYRWKRFRFFIGNFRKKYLLNKLAISDIFISKNIIEDTDTPRPFYRRFYDARTFFIFIKKIFQWRISGFSGEIKINYFKKESSKKLIEFLNENNNNNNK